MPGRGIELQNSFLNMTLGVVHAVVDPGVFTIVCVRQPPDPATVRPEPILRLALAGLKAKWKSGCSYRWESFAHLRSHPASSVRPAQLPCDEDNVRVRCVLSFCTQACQEPAEGHSPRPSGTCPY